MKEKTKLQWWRMRSTETGQNSKRSTLLFCETKIIKQQINESKRWNGPTIEFISNEIFLQGIKKKTSNSLVKLPVCDTGCLGWETDVCVFCWGWAARTREEFFLFCVRNKLGVRIYLYIFTTMWQHMHIIWASTRATEFLFIYLTRRDKVIRIQQVWCSFELWVLGR